MIQTCMTFVAMAAMAAVSSAIELPNSSGLQTNFLKQHLEAASAEEITCNPTGNGPDEQDCPPGLWCAFRDEDHFLIYGQCPDPNVEQEGKCEKVSAICNRMLRPVCGCDGQTKSNNSCTYGANIASRGACGNGEDRGGGSRKEKRRGPPTSANSSYIRPRAPSAGPPAGSPTVASKV